jgi:lysophospholipase L1-like esterase
MSSKKAKRMSSIFTFFLIPFLFFAMTFSTPNQAQTTSLSYLALGDSYTIGEGVGLEDRYPMQLVRDWNKNGKVPFTAPLIIAKTGWTVDELEAGIQANPPAAEGYDLVTLLIGVNNQYRGRSVESFAVDFEKMLERAIVFAKGNKSRVIVLSIPDWGVTPFATQKGVDPIQVAKEIDAYNQAKKEICEKQGIQFIDITDDYRVNGGSAEGVVEDQLHPSKLIYEQWTGKLLSELKKINF